MVIKENENQLLTCLCSTLGIDFSWSLLMFGHTTNSEALTKTNKEILLPSEIMSWLMKVSGLGTGGFLPVSWVPERWEGGGACETCHWLAVAPHPKTCYFLEGTGNFRNYKAAQLWFGPLLTTAVKLNLAGRWERWRNKNKVKTGCNVVLLEVLFSEEGKTTLYEYAESENEKNMFVFISS